MNTVAHNPIEKYFYWSSWFYQTAGIGLGFIHYMISQSKYLRSELISLTQNFNIRWIFDNFKSFTCGVYTNSSNKIFNRKNRVTNYSIKNKPNIHRREIDMPRGWDVMRSRSSFIFGPNESLLILIVRQYSFWNWTSNQHVNSNRSFLDLLIEFGSLLFLQCFF